MAYFPSFGPFYDPEKEQEVYRDNDGSLRVRRRPPTPSGSSVSGSRRLETGNQVKSKIGSNWSEHVHQHQGDLFYIGVNNDNKKRTRSNSLPRPQIDPHLSLSQQKDGSLSRQNGSRHSDSAVLQTRLRRGSSEEDEDEKVRARAELRRKSEQLQMVLRKKQILPRNGQTRTSSRYKRTKTGSAFIQQNNSKLLLSQNSGKADLTQNVGQENSTVPDSSSQKQNGAIQQQTNGRQLKDVTLVPDFTRRADSSTSKANGAELFELLLGIVLCRYKQRSAGGGVVNGDTGDTQTEHKERKLVVQGVVAGSAADKCGNIHRGDMLLHLNGQEVTWSNLTTVLQNVKKEVKLTFQVPKIIGPTSCSPSSQSSSGSGRLPAYHNLCLLVTGRDIFSVQQQLLQYSCVAMYLTLTSSEHENTPHDDIIYSFPPQEESLTAIRGLFLTLSSSLNDIVQCGADSSCLVIGDEVINVVYYKHRRDVFILAAPAHRLPLCLLRTVLRDMCKMLTIVFGAVDKAFHSGESGQLDQVFALFFHRLLCQPGADNNNTNGCDVDAQSGVTPCWQVAADAMCAAPLLQLSEENRLICDEILSEFEAVDFDDFLEENEMYSRRSFTVLGSSLFYKNYLVCSHNWESDLRDMYAFLRCHSLLALASRQPIDELVVWQEVYLTRSQVSGTLGFQEPPARWFLLIVGMKHFLLATLLEAGGCSQEALGKPGPHPLFVDQARATLVQLDTEDVHMSTCCHDRLMEDVESPLTTSTERFMVTGRQARDDTGTIARSSVTSKPPSPGRTGPDNPLKYRSSPRSDRMPGGENDMDSQVGMMRRQGSKLSYGSNDSGGSGSSAGAPKSKVSRFSSLLDMSAIGRSMSALHIDTIGSQTSQGKISRGKDNYLFHFIHHNDLEGVLVTSTDHDLTLSPSNLQNEVMANFHRCVLNIHALFHDFEAEDKPANSKSLFERDCSVSSGAEEHGVLFQCTASPPGASDRRAPLTLNYWVVGRRFSSAAFPSSKHELYVCFHESASQSLVEMAFALGFGT